MQHSDESSNDRKIKASTICVLFILTSLSVGIGSVNAVGANQNDFYQWWGNGYGDLPDDINQIQNMSYLFPV